MSEFNHNMFENDRRIVMTLDAGGTNFVFSAVSGCKEIIDPIRLPAITTDTMRCLECIKEGFMEVKDLLEDNPVAISFAFPGPADYRHGVIGDLPNFPCFRGGVALGPYLERQFGIPVFINNDGNLFAYGEALAGILPSINGRLEACGSRKRYRNLLGITLGTGFGAGVVIDGVLLDGDNGCGGDVWLMRNSKFPSLIAEESVSIRAVKRVYHELSVNDTRDLEPREIYEIAAGRLDGDASAARLAFEEMGIVAADAIANALNIVDGLVVIGGGVSGAHEFFLPAMKRRLSSSLGAMSGGVFPCLQMKVYDLTSESDTELFLKDESHLVDIPGAVGECEYLSERKTGIALSELGASRAISLGAYTFALKSIDRYNKI